MSNMTEVRFNHQKLWESWDFKSDGGMGFADIEQLYISLRVQDDLYRRLGRR